MKKRSLVSAIAMLVVSAIVLTSATFAWFAAGTEVSVDTFSANAQSRDGSILISATGEANTWKTKLTSADYNNAFDSAISLVPVSGTHGEAGMSFIGGALSIDESTSLYKFTTATATGDEYLKYSCYVKSTVDCSVTLTPSISLGDNYIYACVQTASAGYILKSGDDATYTPITTTSSGSTIDTDSDGIISATEAGNGVTLASSATTLNSGSEGTLTLTLTAGSAQRIDVWVWAEGQDPQCAGPVDSTNSSISLSFVKA